MPPNPPPLYAAVCYRQDPQQHIYYPNVTKYSVDDKGNLTLFNGATVVAIHAPGAWQHVSTETTTEG